VLILILLIVSVLKTQQEYDVLGVDVDASKIAECGRLLRDTNRRYLKGFVPMVGSCDVLHAEM
jgi:hypothetical protein